MSDRDLRNASAAVLMTTTFDSTTAWPKTDRLPADFNPEKLLEDSKDPGLGIRKLHQEGIDGRGVTVAILDQALSDESGKIMPHSEYADRIVTYEEYGDARAEGVSMHGPAVTSLLVGKECGTAPGAGLVYKALPPMRHFGLWAKALSKIIESNKAEDSTRKVRVVSCSIGYDIRHPEPDLDEWISAIQQAEESGIIVVHVSGKNLLTFIGGGAPAKKDDIESYDRALFLKEADGLDAYNDQDAHWSDILIVPSDYRTKASCEGKDVYMYNGKGGMSWSVPYLAGVFALALQVNPKLTGLEIGNAIRATASINSKGYKILNPKAAIEVIRSR